MKRILTTLKEKWPEYLLEGLVIVISILLAIWLENWNEQRKETSKEKELLESINYSLNETKKELFQVMTKNSKRVQMLNKLYEAVESRSSHQPTFDTAFNAITTWSSPLLKSTAYENLKAHGFEFIKNDTLKNQLIDLYELSFPQLVEDYDKSEWVLTQSVTNPFFVKNLIQYERAAMPIDYDGLLSNPEFKPILSRVIALRKFGVSLCSKTIATIDKTQQLIQIEN